MRVMVLVKATELSETGAPPPMALIEAMGRFNQDLIDAGMFVDAGGLHASSNAARITFPASGASVTPGPFGNIPDLVSGFWIWKVKSLDEAIAWARRAPMPEGSTLELRPLQGMDDD